MKILLLNLLMNVATGTGDMAVVDDYNWLLDEMNAEVTTVTQVTNITEMVKIFDKAGNLVTEISKADFDENNMNGSQFKLLSKSAHMFDYLGDSYFLLEE